MIWSKFTLKILLLSIVPIAVFFAISTAVQIRGMQDLSARSAAITGQGLREVYGDLLAGRSRDIAEKVKLRLHAVRTELRVLAGAAQTLFDQPALDGLDARLRDVPLLRNDLQVNPDRHHANLAPNDLNISLSVWGYLLDESNHLLPTVEAYTDSVIPMKLILNALGRHGQDKGWLYLVGPKESPVMLMTPWDRMPDIFDRKYPGHNTANWWDFFFPGIIEGWQGWLGAAKPRQPVRDDEITLTPLYEDAGNTGLMVTFFAPLWTPERDRPYGAAALDFRVDNLIDVVRGERIAQSGFAFLMMHDGQVLGVENDMAIRLGLRKETRNDSGVETASYSLSRSAFPDMAAAATATAAAPPGFRVQVVRGQGDATYLLSFQEVTSYNVWGGNGADIHREAVYLGLLVPEAEIFHIQKSVAQEIGEVSRHTLLETAGITAFLLLISATVAGFYALRETKQIRLMSRSANALGARQFDSPVEVVSRDDLGRLAETFNTMIGELQTTYSQLQDHAHTLENRVRERTEHLEIANRELERLSHVDGLTGVHNRRHLDHHLKQKWREYCRSGRQFGVIMIDVDHFKVYNDTYGHQAGDECLKAVAETLSTALHRPTDFIARYGGEEFMVVVENDDQGLCALGATLRAAVEALALEHRAAPHGRVTISLGAALATPAPDDGINALVQRADAALYRSKAEGRNRFTLAAPPGTDVPPPPG